MGSAIEEAIMAGGSRDPVLVEILEVMIIQIRENRPAFPNPLDEPVLYRRLLGKVREALNASERFDGNLDKIFDMAGRG